MDMLSTFQGQVVVYVETQQVKEGVAADLYMFTDDTSKDLAVVRVAAGCQTPLQRVLKGEKTIEGYLSGRATLTVTYPDGVQSVVSYPSDAEPETSVRIGDTMQWSADTDLIFYEICWPPYEDGRFENLS